MEIPFYYNSWWWIIIIVLSFDVFLIMLNSYLRGSIKAYIDIVLGVIFVLAIFLSFFIFNWLIGLLHIIGSFIWGALIQPLAIRVASRILK